MYFKQVLQGELQQKVEYQSPRYPIPPKPIPYYQLMESQSPKKVVTSESVMDEMKQELETIERDSIKSDVPKPIDRNVSDETSERNVVMENASAMVIENVEVNQVTTESHNDVAVNSNTTTEQSSSRDVEVNQVTAVFSRDVEVNNTTTEQSSSNDVEVNSNTTTEQSNETVSDQPNSNQMEEEPSLEDSSSTNNNPSFFNRLFSFVRRLYHSFYSSVF